MTVIEEKGWYELAVLEVDESRKFPGWAEGKAVRKIVPGLGDVAFAGGGDVRNDCEVVAFRKGPRAVRLISTRAHNAAGHVSEAKLMELARQLESRMP